MGVAVIVPKVAMQVMLLRITTHVGADGRSSVVMRWIVRSSGAITRVAVLVPRPFAYGDFVLVAVVETHFG